MDGERGVQDCPGCGRLERENQALRERLAQWERKWEELQRSGHRQATPFRRRRQVEKPKKPGRPQGHARAGRPRPEQIDRVIDVPVERCPDCQIPLEDKTVQEQFQTDLPPVRPVVTQFNVQAGYCPGCKKRVQGRHPEQVSDAVGAAANQVGPVLLTMAAELKHRLGVPYRKITDFFATYLDIAISPGTLVRAEARLVEQARPTFHLLLDALRRSGVVHADETGWRIGRVNAWLWVFSSPRVTIYAIHTTRSAEVPAEVLGAAFDGVLVVDGLKSYDVLEYLKGRCLGHVLRRTGRLSETLSGIDLYYLEELRDLLREAIDLAARRATMTHAGYFRRVGQLENRLDGWLVYHGTRPSEELQRLARHLAEHRQEWFMFLYDPEVPPTNNHAERMLRPAVVARKIGGCNKTLRGALVHGVLASLATSCRQQGKRFLDLALELFRAPAPKAIRLPWLPDG